MSARRTPSTEVLALLLVLVVSGAAWRAALLYPGIDFYQFWLVGRAVAAGEVSDPYPPDAGTRLGAIGREEARRQGGARIRAAAAERRVVEVFSTPFLYAAFAAVASGDYERDHRRFQLGSLLAALAAVGLLARVLGYGLLGSCLAVALLGVLFEPYQSDTTVGNVNRLLLLALAAFVALQPGPGRWWRSLLAGAVLGLALAFKPTFAFAAGLLGFARLLEGRWARLAWEAAGGLLGASVALLSSVWILGSAGLWRAWLGALERLSGGFPLPVQSGNLALVKLLEEATGRSLGIPIGALLALLLLAALVWRSRGAELRAAPLATPGQPARDALLLGAGLTATLLFGRLAWQHYFLLTAPALLALTRPRPAGGAERALLIAGAAAWFLLSFQAFRLFASTSAWLAAATTAGGAGLLLAAALPELARRAPEPPPDPEPMTPPPLEPGGPPATAGTPGSGS